MTLAEVEHIPLQDMRHGARESTVWRAAAHQQLWLPNVPVTLLAGTATFLFPHLYLIPTPFGGVLGP